MKYVSASEILPEYLVREIQKYIQGNALYIPSPAGHRKKWGQASGQRDSLSKRNSEIREMFHKGVSIDRLSKSFYLSEDSIKKIVYRRE